MRFESILYHLNRGKVGAEGLLEEQMAIEKGGGEEAHLEA
jgi:hypothetical protein